jgi:hypothetical protein
MKKKMRVRWICGFVAELTQFAMKLAGPVCLVPILLRLAFATAFQLLPEAG